METDDEEDNIETIVDTHTHNGEDIKDSEHTATDGQYHESSRKRDKVTHLDENYQTQIKEDIFTRGVAYLHSTEKCNCEQCTKDTRKQNKYSSVREKDRQKSENFKIKSDNEENFRQTSREIECDECERNKKENCSSFDIKRVSKLPQRKKYNSQQCNHETCREKWLENRKRNRKKPKRNNSKYSNKCRCPEKGNDRNIRIA